MGVSHGRHDAAHLLGVVSIVLFATGHLLAGALVFEVRFVLDCVDGKLARATGRSSLFGALLDTVGDRVLLVANVAALGWGRAPAAVALLAAAYPLQSHLIELRLDLHDRAGEHLPIDRAMQHRWGAAMVRRRLYPFPTSVDVEHAVLFLGPLAWAAGVDLLHPLLWVAASFFALQTVRYGVGALRAARILDRAGQPT